MLRGFGSTLTMLDGASGGAGASGGSMGYDQGGGGGGGPRQFEGPAEDYSRSNLDDEIPF